jgi:hypothetical protein
VYDGTNILIAHNTIGDTAGPIVDLEPVAARWEVDNVDVIDNVVGTHENPFAFTAPGGSMTNNNLLFEGNSSVGSDLTFDLGSNSNPPPVRHNVRVIDNRSNKSNATKQWILARGIAGLVIEGNTASVRGTAVSLYNCSSVSVNGNQFLGANVVINATGQSSAISQQGNRTT